MSDLALKMENVSKLYQLGEVGTGTISHDLNRWWAKLRGKEDPRSGLGVINDRETTGDDFVWAIKDINFEVNKGEIIGIIGRNGAGKSTLLKLLARVTGPTTGEIFVNGKIASLLEVGTGFHPELTGRENIFLNGAILGMSHKEIASKLCEIVDFSGCEKYIDTPVKRYSSGMHVRLAFAVAAHLEPDILIVDEVLAVGDAEFQAKCLGKMKDVSKNSGRTVLFVSHNLESVRKLCPKSILVDKGRIDTFDDTDLVIDKYLGSEIESVRELVWPRDNNPGKGGLDIEKVTIKDDCGNIEKPLVSGDKLIISIHYILKQSYKDLRVCLTLLASDFSILFCTSDYGFQSKMRSPGKYISDCILPADFLSVGRYYIKIDIEVMREGSLLSEVTLPFEIMELSSNQLGFTVQRAPPGHLHPQLEWHVSPLESE